MKLRPLGDRVVLKYQKAEEKTQTGIILPDSAKEKPQEATVIAVGAGDRENTEMHVKEGDKVIFSKYAGTEVKLNSNGETALEYFDSKLKNDTLYCLDEPENSLSLENQMKLVEYIESSAHWFNCQFIIATHSPSIFGKGWGDKVQLVSKLSSDDK